jgi:formylglycine-generating enzyme required for sulfatase activity
MKTKHNFCFLLAILLIFIVGCAKAPKMIEQPKPVAQPPQVTPKSVVTVEELKELSPAIIGKDGSKMSLIPAGEFLMGSPEGEGVADEHPQHTVFLDAFYIAAYEVTNAQFQKFLEANPQWQKDKIEGRYHDGNYLKDWNNTNYPIGKANHPVVYVSWYAAAAYAQWIGARLPMESQWEKAARGGLVGKQYPWGDEITHDHANYRGTGGRDQWNSPAPVGSFSANGYGLFDVAGNVWEWCADEYDPIYYESTPKNNPAGPVTMVTFANNDFINVITSRVLRGGTWYDNTNRLRCAGRFNRSPAYAVGGVGFRCVVVPAED